MPKATTYDTQVLRATTTCVIPVRKPGTDSRDGFAMVEYVVTLDVEALVRETAYAAAHAKRQVVTRANGAVTVRATRMTRRMPEGGEWQEVNHGK
jgi:hypothetical protein